ncbi:MAG: anaerobic ribonucleoside-triphosphate reductase activating protein [Zetaproteobacteria bacterium]|nr:MAG: anaerobic ribonucleoside-triphosphate reductase activating protein [Zetaproteobacteria bacterium]
MPENFSHPHAAGGGKKITLPIYDVTPFTMLDFPGKCAAIIWFSGCNMRCGYCHNPQIVKGKGTQNIDNVLEFLKKRQNLLDGIVLSGGEASIYTELPNFVRKVKDMGYAIKLDTNGTRPDVILDFLDHNLLDYVALDYKSPPEKFKTVTGIDKFKDFEKTLDILCTQNTVPFEIRTTVHTALMNEQDVESIINDLDQRQYKGTFYIQNYINNGGPTLAFLPKQTHELNTNAFSQKQGFLIEFRNFS